MDSFMAELSATGGSDADDVVCFGVLTSRIRVIPVPSCPPLSMIHHLQPLKAL